MSATSFSRRMALTTLGAATATGCFGSFGLTNLLYDWNDSFGNKWLKWLMFLVLGILPIYGIAIAVDVIVLNSMEFWFGSNPVASTNLPEGHRVASKQTEDPNVVRHEIYKGEKKVAVLYVEKVNENEVRFLDEHGRVLTRVHLGSDELRLEDEHANPIAGLAPQACENVKRAHEAGVPVREAVFDELAASGQAPGIAEAAARIQHRILL